MKETIVGSKFEVFLLMVLSCDLYILAFVGLAKPLVFCRTEVSSFVSSN